MDHALAVDHGNVLDPGADADQQLHAGDRGSAGAEADDLRLFQLLAGDFQGVDHAGRGDDGGTVLVIVEHRNVALLDQGTFDLKALGRLDVFQVDATEGDGDAFNGVNESLWAFRIDFDVEYVDTSETLEQNTLAFHHWLGSQWAEVTQTEDGSAIGNHRNQVAFAGVFVSQLWITANFAHRLCNTWAVGQGEVTGGGSGLGEFNAQFPRTRLSVIFESGGFQV
ncbi:hypothetical protein D9M73_157630 [compost metagenome]